MAFDQSAGLRITEMHRKTQGMASGLKQRVAARLSGNMDLSALHALRTQG
jgi:hypothetical protein